MGMLIVGEVSGAVFRSPECAYITSEHMLKHASLLLF